MNPEPSPCIISVVRLIPSTPTPLTGGGAVAATVGEKGVPPQIFSPCPPQAVELYLDEKVSYLDITRLVGECCDAHMQELVGSPSLDEIVHFDGWAREWVAAAAAGAKKVAVAA